MSHQYDGISVVTTTYNEHENIVKLIPLLHEVLKNISHEIIVVDDSSLDGTFEAARELADLAIRKAREGQTVGLLFGMKHSRYPVVVTIDADLENPPNIIPTIVEKALNGYDVIVASRTRLLRFSEKLSSITLGRIIGIHDAFSNFRVYSKAVVDRLEIDCGETFGAELLVRAKIQGCRLGELFYDPPPRRSSPRIGGKVRANLRILNALLKSLLLYYVLRAKSL